jgi:hypothetical protein
MVYIVQVSYLEGMVLEHLLDKNQCIKFGDGLDDLLHFFICHFYQLTIVLLTWQWTHPFSGDPRVLLQETDCDQHTTRIQMLLFFIANNTFWFFSDGVLVMSQICIFGYDLLFGQNKHLYGSG